MISVSVHINLVNILYTNYYCVLVMSFSQGTVPVNCCGWYDAMSYLQEHQVPNYRLSITQRAVSVTALA